MARFYNGAMDVLTETCFLCYNFQVCGGLGKYCGTMGEGKAKSMEQETSMPMKSVKLHTYRIPIADVGLKHFFHFSDVHLSLYDAHSTEEQRTNALKRENEWLKVRDYFADKHEGGLPDERRISAKAHFENLLKASGHCSCLVTTGDLLDYISEANMKYLVRQLSDYPNPYMAVRGNHENPSLQGDHEAIENPLKCGMEKPVQVIDFEDLLLLGIDNSDLKISIGQLQALEKHASTGKPVLIAMHAPIVTEMNRSALEQARSYDYFILNHEGCPSENTDFVKMILDKKYNVRGVLTGHLHFQCVTPLSERVWMYGVSQGIAGHLNEYWIGG